MNKWIKGLIAIVVIIVIGGVIWFVAVNQPKTTNAPQANTNTSPSGDTTPPAVNGKVAATITYDGTTFSPQQTTVASGNNIKVVNQSSHELQFDSDPHPVHTDDTDLNAGSIAPGQSKIFTVTQKGQFGFHNHLDPAQRANITIQ